MGGLGYNLTLGLACVARLEMCAVWGGGHLLSRCVWSRPPHVSSLAVCAHGCIARVEQREPVRRTCTLFTYSADRVPFAAGPCLGGLVVGYYSCVKQLCHRLLLTVYCWSRPIGCLHSGFAATAHNQGQTRTTKHNHVQHTHINITLNLAT